jgi:hypothetical protein
VSSYKDDSIRQIFDPSGGGSESLAPKVPVLSRNSLQKVEKKSVLLREFRAGAVRERVSLKQGLNR